MRPFLLLGIVLTLSAQAPPDLIARHLAAVGGQRLHEVQRLRIKAKLTSGTQTVAVTVTRARPNLFRMDATIGGITVSQGYDGTTAWVNDPTGTPDDHLLADIAANADFNGPLENPNNTITILPTDNEGHHVRLTTPAAVELLTFDTATFLVTRNEKQHRNETSPETTTTYADYRTINGITLPYTTTFTTTGRTYTMTVTNVDVDPALPHGWAAKPRSTP